MKNYLEEIKDKYKEYNPDNKQIYLELLEKTKFIKRKFEKLSMNMLFQWANQLIELINNENTPLENIMVYKFTLNCLIAYLEDILIEKNETI